MKKFIKLTDKIINPLMITTINSFNDKYYIHMANSNVSGFLFIYFGTIYTNNDIIEICKNKNPLDYRLIQNWINEI